MNRRATRTVVERPGAVDRRDDALRQPDDRDESADDAARSASLAPVQHDQMERARRDADGPTQDTDCHGVPAAEGTCQRPSDPALLDDVLRPGGRDAENRRGASHDPGAPAAGPDGAPGT